MSVDHQTVSERHITSSANIFGGKPCVAGTRIRVWDIHIWHNLCGRSPHEIVAEYPQLSLSNVHAALAYYHDHRDELERAAEDDDRFVESLKQKQGPTRFTMLRDQILGTSDGIVPDSVSS